MFTGKPFAAAIIELTSQNWRVLLVTGTISIVRIAASIVFCAALLHASAAPSDKLLHVRVAMRDGIHLDTNVFHPAGASRYPAILIRTPYGKGTDFPPGYASFVDRGYAVVLQDVRGRYASEGVFNMLNQ